MATTHIRRHYAEYHRPHFYRYEVADPGFRLLRNTYGSRKHDDVIKFDTGDQDVLTGVAWIGLCLVVSRYAYCVKWANAEISGASNV